ncbi:ankyrin repeat protein [Acanthamoeba polyphaga moumouvirus]|uniref:Ankyrin repeat protein n=1 Tax=Acanthamoeba polyphaga moumouvirus TaxID=1269028 RepID=L7RCP2_9VIRU|nr:ankyrin repeat protein [Acanthamoeba polyphaga moumouvirus]AGC02384.1 ankyrin repeat protein [Acanthamoeba polyphaga moumouvirus]
MPKFKYCLSCRYKDRILKYCKKSGKYHKLYYTKDDYMIIKFCNNNGHQYIKIDIDDMINFMKFVLIRNYHCGGVYDYYYKCDMKDVPLGNIEEESDDSDNSDNSENNSSNYDDSEDSDSGDSNNGDNDSEDKDDSENSDDEDDDDDDEDSDEDEDDDEDSDEDEFDCLSCGHECKHRYYTMEYVKYIFKHNMMDHIKLFLKKQHDPYDFEGLYGNLSLVQEEDDEGENELSCEVITYSLQLSNYKTSKYVICNIYAEPHRILNRLAKHLKLYEIHKYLRICTSKIYFESMLKLFDDGSLDLSKILWLIARYDNIDIFKYIIEEFSKVKNRVGKMCQKDFTFNKKVAQKVFRFNEDKFNIVKYLIQNGVDIQARNNEALIHACGENFRVVKFLVENGADIHAKNGKPLEEACDHGHIDIVQYLIEKGANINANNGKALISACFGGHLDVVNI